MRIACALLGVALLGASEALQPIAGLGHARAQRIDSIDLAAEHERVHAVYVVQGGASVPDRLEYIRSDRPGAGWTPPLLVASVPIDSVRVAVVGGVLHVVAGQRLNHWTLPSAPAAPAAGLFDAAADRALAFEAAGSDAALWVAVIAGTTIGRAAQTPLELRVIRVGPGGERHSTVVGRFAPSVFSQVSPAMVIDGATVRVCAALNLESHVNSGGVDAISAAARIVYSESHDAGRTWTPVTDVVPPGRFSSVSGIALDGPGRTIYVSSFGIFRSDFRSGGWRDPVQIAPYRTSIAIGSERSGDVAVSGGIVAWIDGRFTRSDRRWWNPLGGFPWSDDDPLWSNNDVFSMRTADAGNASPTRLTGDETYAAALRLRTDGGRVLAAWAGRTHVSKRLADSPDPPAVFVAEIDVQTLSARDRR